jgi:heat-inducible transcriptional repressor
MVGRSGVVQNRIIENLEPLEQEELDRIGRYLTEEFGGHTLPEMRSLLAERLQEERSRYDKLRARSLELGRRALDKAPEGEVFVEGTSNLVGSPDFGDLNEIRALLHTLEQKESLLELLSKLLGGDGVQVMIGGENPVSDLARCSLVAAGYGTGERTLGTLGIVGPTRMGYARAIALVDHLAKVVTRLLSERRH